MLLAVEGLDVGCPLVLLFELANAPSRSFWWIFWIETLNFWTSF